MVRLRIFVAVVLVVVAACKTTGSGERVRPTLKRAPPPSGQDSYTLVAGDVIAAAADYGAATGDADDLFSTSVALLASQDPKVLADAARSEAYRNYVASLPDPSLNLSGDSMSDLPLIWVGASWLALGAVGYGAEAAGCFVERSEARRAAERFDEEATRIVRQANLEFAELDARQWTEPKEGAARAVRAARQAEIDALPSRTSTFGATSTPRLIRTGGVALMTIAAVGGAMTAGYAVLESPRGKRARERVSRAFDLTDGSALAIENLQLALESAVGRVKRLAAAGTGLALARPGCKHDVIASAVERMQVDFSALRAHDASQKARLAGSPEAAERHLAVRRMGQQVDEDWQAADERIFRSAHAPVGGDEVLQELGAGDLPAESAASLFVGSDAIGRTRSGRLASGARVLVRDLNAEAPEARIASEAVTRRSLPVHPSIGRHYGQIMRGAGAQRQLRVVDEWGEPLNQWVRANGDVSFAMQLQLVDGLATLHRFGMQHGAVGAEAIFVARTPEGPVLKLGDPRGALGFAPTIDARASVAWAPESRVMALMTQDVREELRGLVDAVESAAERKRIDEKGGVSRRFRDRVNVWYRALSRADRAKVDQALGIKGASGKASKRAFAVQQAIAVRADGSAPADVYSMGMLLRSLNRERSAKGKLAKINDKKLRTLVDEMVVIDPSKRPSLAQVVTRLSRIWQQEPKV